MIRTPATPHPAAPHPAAPRRSAARSGPRLRTAFAAACIALAFAGPAAAQSSSDLSAASMLPVAVSVVAPVSLLTAGAALTVVSVQATAQGTVWVLERASDGARASIAWGARAAGTASVAAGTAVTVSALGTGWLLSAAGQALAFVPNELGRALLHHERITP